MSGPHGRTVGVRGAPWRADVDAIGTVHPHDGSRPLAWHVAGDDRWFSPAVEPTVRQKWYSGYPVCETRMRVGSGDVVQRVYCVADAGGITVVEFENETTATVAVAVTRDDVLAARELAPNPPRGIDLPEGSVVLPLGHHATTRIGISHVGTGRGLLPDGLADHRQVVRGWETACDAASRIGLADHSVVATVCRARSEMLLDPAGAVDDGAAAELVRLGERYTDAVLDVVDAAARRLKSERRSRTLAWDTRHHLGVAARACVLLGDETAAGDIGAAWLRLADRPSEPLPATVPEGAAAIAWAESLLAAGWPSGGRCDLVPFGIPEPWWGSNFEGHGLVADPWRTVSFAVRWHGERPAVLWEVDGPAGLVLSAGDADPQWHSVESRGEALLAAPARVRA